MAETAEGRTLYAVQLKLCMSVRPRKLPTIRVDWRRRTENLQVHRGHTEEGRSTMQWLVVVDNGCQQLTYCCRILHFEPDHLAHAGRCVLTCASGFGVLDKALRN